MNPADQSQSATAQRAAEPPTLWLSLALGSVLIHLVLFILASLVSNQTAKVQLDIEPIAVEFVNPKTTQSAGLGRAIAVRPGKPSSTQPSSTQVQPNEPPRSSSLNQPVEQPFVPLQPVKRKQLPIRPRPPQPSVSNNSLSRQPDLNQPSQSDTSSNRSQEGLSGASSGDETQQPDPQQPARSTTKIVEPSQKRDVLVDIEKSYETGEFHPKIASIKSPISASILDSPPIAQALKQGIAMTVSLDIAENGFSKVIDTRPGLGNTLGQATLDKLTEQIFTDLQFEPAEYDPGGFTKKPRRSNLIIKARIRLP